MACEMRATLSASNSALPPVDSSVDAVLDSSTFALSSGVAGVAVTTALPVYGVSAATAGPAPGVTAGGFSAGLPIFMVISKGSAWRPAHSTWTVYRPPCHRL